jgi:hypothetical protein
VPVEPLSTEELLDRLAKTPDHLAVQARALSPNQLRARPSADEWSANEVLAHLRACADVWGSCIAEILAQPNPVIRAVNPRTWILRTNYLDLEFGESLEVFTRQRAELLARLKPLQPGNWERSATVTGAGRPLVRSVQTSARRMALHEQCHLKQIAAIVKRFQTD